MAPPQKTHIYEDIRDIECINFVLNINMIRYLQLLHRLEALHTHDTPTQMILIILDDKSSPHHSHSPVSFIAP